MSKLKNQEAKAPYFVTYVRDKLLEKYGANLLYNGGLKVYTTLDLELQKYAEESMASAPIFVSRPIEKDPMLNGSLVCLDPHNGHIKSIVWWKKFQAIAV